MAYRTTVENVRAELEPEEYPIAELTNNQVEVIGIEPANLYVTEQLASSDMSDDRLRLIERYLAGHNILVSGIDQLRQVTQERLSDMSSATYAGTFDKESLHSTTLGQKALFLDESGALRRSSEKSASIMVPDSRGIDSDETETRRLE